MEQKQFYDSILLSKNNNYNNNYDKERIDIRKIGIQLKSNRSTNHSFIIKSKRNNSKKNKDYNINNKLSQTFQFGNDSSYHIRKLSIKKLSINKKRINSCIILSPKMKKDKDISKLFKKKFIKKKEAETSINFKKVKKCNAYYYSGSLPIKNKYIVDSISQDKSLSSSYFRRNNNNISSTYRKIDHLAKYLCLFQREKKLFENNKNFSEKYFKLYKKQLLNNNFNKSLINFKKSFIICESFNSKESEKIKNKNISFIKEKNSNIIIRKNSSLLKAKNSTYRGNSNNNNSNYNISHNINAYNGNEDSEYLYKKIFFYNLEKKKRKPLKYVDNKLNLVYSENESQYKQKMNRLNDYFFKLGKPIKHKLLSSTENLNTSDIVNKIKFMKKIVDYVYPKMVLDKVKEENRKIYRDKSLNFKMSISKLMLLKMKKKKKKINDFLGKSISLIK